jgi:hypothetical protein
MLDTRPVRAVVVLQVSQVGPNVLVSGSGSANLNALTNEGGQTEWTNTLSEAEIYAGPAAFVDGNVNLWSGLSGGPSSISTDSNLLEYPDDASSSGDLFGLFIDNGSPRLVLPTGYSSNDPLNGTSVFLNLTLADLGLPDGTTTWSWGSGADADSFVLQVNGAQPVPAPLPIAATAAAYSWSRRLRRRIGEASSSIRPQA